VIKFAPFQRMDKELSSRRGGRFPPSLFLIFQPGVEELEEGEHCPLSCRTCEDTFIRRQPFLPSPVSPWRPSSNVTMR